MAFSFKYLKGIIQDGDRHIMQDVLHYDWADYFRRVFSCEGNSNRLSIFKYLCLKKEALIIGEQNQVSYSL